MKELTAKVATTTNKITEIKNKEFLKPCPFCGGKAMVESVEGSGMGVQAGAWSVGCSDEDGHCYGYQSLTTFARRSEAIEAWNKRSNECTCIEAKIVGKQED